MIIIRIKIKRRKIKKKKKIIKKKRKKIIKKKKKNIASIFQAMQLIPTAHPLYKKM